jgi:hypothetical protein
MEEVFKVAAADVACLDDDDKRSAAAVSGESGRDGPMAEAAAAATAAAAGGRGLLASVGDRCELLSQQQQLTRGGQGQRVVSRGDSGQAAGRRRGLRERRQRRSELPEGVSASVSTMMSTLS